MSDEGTATGDSARIAGEPIRVIVGDDHPMIREAIRRRLTGVPDIVLAGEAANGEEVLALLAGAEDPVHVAILDIHMPPMNGLETAEAIIRTYPGVEILILTGAAESEVVLEGFRRGAKGYLLKHRDARQVIEAVRLVARGTIVIDPDLVDAVVLQMTRTGREPETALTSRELEVLKLVASGRPNSEIGRALFVSSSTVKADLVQIMQKLEANDRTSAVAEAFRRRLIE